MNYAKTAVLLAVLTAIFVAMGAVVGGQTGMIIAFLIALVMNIVSLWNSDMIVLRLFRAEQVNEETAPVYYQLVRDLAKRADLPMPKVFILPSRQPNAFATGRSPSHASIAASTGLLETLNNEELSGVIAHELAHIKNRDTLTMTVAATIGGAISMMANYLQFSLIFGGRDDRSGPFGWIGVLIAVIAAPFAAMLVQMAISRSREYQADRLGALICGNPMWLASALRKIHKTARRITNKSAEAVPAAAHMFIVNPLTGRGFDNWFSTHPDIENRISELQELAREGDLLPYNIPSSLGRASSRSSPYEGRLSEDVTGPWQQHGSSPRPHRKRGPWG